jgi:hypothetical protein
LSTLVAEVYGPNYKGQIKVAVKEILHKTDGVVDIDWTVGQSNGIQTGSRKGKAMLNGIAPQQIVPYLY